MIDKHDLIGAWQLESWSIGYEDREDFTQPFGEDPLGLLVYSEDGWMSASISRRKRPHLPENESPRKVPESLKAEAYASYFHYAGRFRIKEGVVTHYVTQSLNPNFPGTEQVRHAELDGQTLVLSGKDQVRGVTRYHTLVWHKAPRTAD